jgi:hypothetical protein
VQVLGTFQSFKILPSLLVTLVKPSGLKFKVTPKGKAARGAGYDRKVFRTAATCMGLTAAGILINILPEWRINFDQSTAFVRRNERVPNLAGSSPILATHSCTSRAYCSRQPMWTIATTGEEELIRLASGQAQVLVDGRTGLVCELEPYRPARLALPNGCPIDGIPTRCHVIHAYGHEITSAQLAVDGEVEQSEVALSIRRLQLCPDGPNMAGPQRRLCANQLALIPRWTAGGCRVVGI